MMETAIQNVWTKSKLLVKALIIGIIILVLLIPTAYVTDLIYEREARQKQAINAVSNKWARKQQIAGPLLVVPYWQTDGGNPQQRTRHQAYFLPDDLAIQSIIHPEKKYPGVYQVTVYTSKSHISGTFRNLQPEQLNIAPENVLWKEAFVQLHVSDAKGLNEEVKMNCKGQAYSLTPDAPGDKPQAEAMTARLKLQSAEDAREIPFAIDLDLSGSEQLLFTPAARVTSVELKGRWSNPGFLGDLMPLSTDIKKDSFSAKWKTGLLKRSFPQQWKDNAFGFYPVAENAAASPDNINGTAFGASLSVPVSDYQKIMRSVKYAVFCIVLTFAAFFVIETTNGRSVHPFQYGLIGLALVLFYTLLLSFSEYIGFNWSYIIASAATIGLIAWFVKGILVSSRMSILLSSVLLLVYTYVFTILQLQEFSLLLGSIGLFITLGVVMHFSKKIKW